MQKSSSWFDTAGMIITAIIIIVVALVVGILLLIYFDGLRTFIIGLLSIGIFMVTICGISEIVNKRFGKELIICIICALVFIPLMLSIIYISACIENELFDIHYVFSQVIIGSITCIWDTFLFMMLCSIIGIPLALMAWDKQPPRY